MTPLAVFVGGGAGALLRWGVGLAVPSPWGTLAVNLLGSFAIAWLAHPAHGLGDAGRAWLVTGLLGGFTTYSAFDQQVVDLATSGRWAAAAGWAALMVGTCLAAGLGGHFAAGRG